MAKMVKEITGFEFAEIPLEEAQNAVMAGEGNYSDLRAQLLDRLPKLAPDKAFAFGLPKGREVPEDQRRGICTAINITLRKANHLWKVTYSSNRKLFICTPRILRKAKGSLLEKAAPAPKRLGPPVAEEQAIVKFYRENTLTADEVAEKFGISRSRTAYLIYQKYGTRGHDLGDSSATPLLPEKTLESKPKTTKHSPKRSMDLAKSKEIIQRLHGKAEELFGKEYNHDVIRKAVINVASESYGLTCGDIAPHVYLSAKGVQHHFRTKAAAAKEIEALSK